MSGKAISNTYKGILRISNNIDIFNNVKDKFLNDNYYFQTNSDEWAGNGIQLTQDFLSESSSVKRYKSEDEYLNVKVPLTDSCGNFLNIFLGVSGSTIGSNCAMGIVSPATNQFNDNDNKTFSVLNAIDSIIIGRSKQPEEKTLGINLNIHNSEYSPAKMVVVNKFRHSGRILTNTDDNETLRTIYDISNKSPKEYDIFFYDQENYEKNGNVKDCKVTLKNLKEYVYERVLNYIQSNSCGVPTGTIISQYCNLDKWYCWDSESKTFNDLDKWQGYRPAMITGPDAPYSYYNTIQGKVVKTPSYLYFNDDSGSLNAYTPELVPEFKRGYALCDGGSLEIALRPYWMQNAVNHHKSVDILLELFHVIGYYYHKDNIFTPIHECIKTGNYYSYNDGYNYWLETVETDRDICYGISMATILAFKALDEKFLNETNPFTGETDEIKLEKCLTWLSKQKIPEKYIFNVIFPNSLSDRFPNAYYKYDDTKGVIKNYVNIGREINSFDAYIPYYVYDKHTDSCTIEACKIINTAEIRDIAMLYINRQKHQTNWERYNYVFYLPQLFTYTDTEINDAYRALNENINDVTIGQFIGSNGLVVRDSIIDPAKNTTIDPSKKYHSWNCIYRHSYGYEAHAHAITKGKTSIKTNVDGIYYDPLLDKDVGHDDKGTRIANLSRPKIENYNIVSETLSNKNIVVANYNKDSYSPKDANGKYIYKDILEYKLMDSYILQDHPTYGNKRSWDNTNIVYTLSSGTIGYDTVALDANGNIDEAYKWYGRTSEPLWCKHDISKTENYTEKLDSMIGYFTPESIKVMPLIKL